MATWEGPGPEIWGAAKWFGLHLVYVRGRPNKLYIADPHGMWDPSVKAAHWSRIGRFKSLLQKFGYRAKLGVWQLVGNYNHCYFAEEVLIT
ncbi:MAG: hypothetical protein JWO84_6 [Parcubacteria group bacterium]|nr:hypothetical protein [Parcubacteria group bacterium]